MTSADGPRRRRSAEGRLFRPEAIAHHRSGRDEVRLPHYATLPIRLALWTLIAVVLLVAGWASTTSVPRYTSGRAVVVDSVNGPLIMVLVPSGERGRLHEGDLLTVTFDRSPELVPAQVSGVLPAAQQTGAGDCLPAAFDALGIPAGDRPARAVATFLTPAATVPVGSTGQARVLTGRESLLSWIGS